MTIDPEVLARLKDAQASGALTLSVEGGGINERKSLVNAHAVVVLRSDLDAVLVELRAAPEGP